MKNQDADLGMLDGDLLIGRAHGPTDDVIVIELDDEDVFDEDELLADDGDLDVEPETRD